MPVMLSVHRSDLSLRIILSKKLEERERKSNNRIRNLLVVISFTSHPSPCHKTGLAQFPSSTSSLKGHDT